MGRLKAQGTQSVTCADTAPYFLRERLRRDGKSVSAADKAPTWWAASAFSYPQAELTWQGNQRRYQLGMLGRIEYLSTEIQYVQAKAARDTARMNMLQALNEYNWALKGVVPAEI